MLPKVFERYGDTWFLLYLADIVLQGVGATVCCRSLAIYKIPGGGQDLPLVLQNKGLVAHNIGTNKVIRGSRSVIRGPWPTKKWKYQIRGWCASRRYQYILLSYPYIISNSKPKVWSIFVYHVRAVAVLNAMRDSKPGMAPKAG